MSTQTPPQPRSQTPRTFKARWEYAAVFIGGAVGSILREVIAPYGLGPDWATATFVPNILACFVIGWLFAIRHRIHAHIIHLGAVGFCGGLSTFSTFAAEIFFALKIGDVFGALQSSGAEIAFGIAAALVGEMVGRRGHSAS